jgi:hypothetical protein
MSPPDHRAMKTVSMPRRDDAADPSPKPILRMTLIVMPGRSRASLAPLVLRWMAGSSPAMTRGIHGSFWISYKVSPAQA